MESLQTPSSNSLKPVPTEQLQEFIFGAVSVESSAEGLIPWRLDAGRAAFFQPDLKTMAARTSGVHIRFVTSAESVALEFDILGNVEDNLMCELDLFVDDISVVRKQFRAGQTHSLAASGLPQGEKEITIYLPTNGAVLLRCLSISDSSSIDLPPKRPRWITHGSSITHCVGSDGPANTWPAIVAREKAWDAWNLGFAGQCKFDPIVARTIARMPAERISLCLGINTAAGFYSLRTWIPAVEGFIMNVRDGHPTTPLLVISPILSPPRETFDTAPTQIGLQTMRTHLEAIVERFRDAGDANIYYLSGLKIIGLGDESTMPDQLHPDADGMKLMAERFMANIPAAWG